MRAPENTKPGAELPAGRTSRDCAISATVLPARQRTGWAHAHDAHGFCRGKISIAPKMQRLATTQKCERSVDRRMRSGLRPLRRPGWSSYESRDRSRGRHPGWRQRSLSPGDAHARQAFRYPQSLGMGASDLATMWVEWGSWVRTCNGSGQVKLRQVGEVTKPTLKLEMIEPQQCDDIDDVGRHHAGLDRVRRGFVERAGRGATTRANHRARLAGALTLKTRLSMVSTASLLRQPLGLDQRLPGREVERMADRCGNQTSALAVRRRANFQPELPRPSRGPRARRTRAAATTGIRRRDRGWRAVAACGGSSRRLRAARSAAGSRGSAIARHASGLGGGSCAKE